MEFGIQALSFMELSTSLEVEFAVLQQVKHLLEFQIEKNILESLRFPKSYLLSF